MLTFTVTSTPPYLQAPRLPADPFVRGRSCEINLYLEKRRIDESRRL